MAVFIIRRLAAQVIGDDLIGGSEAGLSLVAGCPGLLGRPVIGWRSTFLRLRDGSETIRSRRFLPSNYCLAFFCHVGFLTTS